MLPMQLGLTGISTLAGQVILGKALSTTVSVKEQMVWLLAASVAVSTMVVVPLIVVRGRGYCVIETPGQLSITVILLAYGGTPA